MVYRGTERREGQGERIKHVCASQSQDRALCACACMFSSFCKVHFRARVSREFSCFHNKICHYTLIENRSVVFCLCALGNFAFTLFYLLGGLG